MDKLIEQSLVAVRESKFIEFQSEFDPSSNQDWWEVIKDVIAISNSGRGVIVFGLDDTGNPTGYDATPLLQMDSAEITDKIAKYVSFQFSDFELVEREKNGIPLALMLIESSHIPLVFRKPGTYRIKGNRQKDFQKSAFKEGTVYFRHGAKSSPGNTDDLQRSFKKELKRTRKSWLKDIAKISTSPSGLEVVIVHKAVGSTASRTADVVRLTTDPRAPIIGAVDLDITHPYRQKELIAKVKENITDDVRFNSYDARSLWHAHDIGNHPDFYHYPKFGSPQYSDAYVDWIVKCYSKDKKFFDKTRKRYVAIKRA